MGTRDVKYGPGGPQDQLIPSKLSRFSVECQYIH